MSLVDRLLALQRPLLTALDVDGTLAPIVLDPDAATIPVSTLGSLEALVRAPEVQVALITGRDLASLSRMESLEGVWRGVEHGGLVLAPGERSQPRTLSEEHRRALDRFRVWVDEHADDAFVEYKPNAIAVHVRTLSERAPERARHLLDRAEAFARSLGLHVRKGRSVREAETARHDKGEALAEIFERSGAKSVFFAGDDITDMPAIEFAIERGVGGFVVSDERPEPPLHRAVPLDGVDAVASLLAELADRLS